MSSWSRVLQAVLEMWVLFCPYQLLCTYCQARCINMAFKKKQLCHMHFHYIQLDYQQFSHS